MRPYPLEERHRGFMHTEKRSWEDTMRRQPSASQGERPQERGQGERPQERGQGERPQICQPNLLTPILDLQSCETIHFFLSQEKKDIVRKKRVASVYSVFLSAKT